MPISIYMLSVALLLLISIYFSKLSSRFGVPALLIFLAIGMIIGSDGLNLIYFDDYHFAQSLGIIALSYILFSGGLDTNWVKVRPIISPGVSLATIGTFVTAVVVGLFTSWILDFTFLEGALLGATICSTDAAAVFMVLRSKAIGFKYRLKELLEFESGSNDPMAVILTIGIIQLITLPDYSWITLIGFFIQQMFLGLAAGYLFGKIITWVINHIDLEYDGLYPVLILALVPLIYSATDLMGGSGFLAVYLAGLMLGNANFIHQRSLVNFADGIAWLMQIVMFLMLGLLVFPNKIIEIAGAGLLIALVLIFIARPISVFIALMFSRFSARSKLMISWTGLRGAVPIIMSTFPLVAGLPNAELIFSIVFFVVVTSVLIQGPTLPFMARLLHVDSPIKVKTRFPIIFEPSMDTKGALKEIEIEDGDAAVGKQVVELGFPEKALIVIINREGEFLVPKGTTQLQEHDKLLVLARKEMLARIREIIKGKSFNEPDE